MNCHNILHQQKYRRVKYNQITVQFYKLNFLHFFEKLKTFDPDFCVQKSVFTLFWIFAIFSTFIFAIIVSHSIPILQISFFTLLIVLYLYNCWNKILEKNLVNLFILSIKTRHKLLIAYLPCLKWGFPSKLLRCV